MSLMDVARRIAFANSAKGFDFTEREIDQKLLLAISEICEAQEELRDGHRIQDIYYDDSDKLGSIVESRIKRYHAGADLSTFPAHMKPEGFPVEIADAIIRLLHICANFNIDIDAVIELKLAFNATRPMKHGRKF